MGDRDQVARCESESGMDDEQELGGESVVVRYRNDDERGVGVVQEDAEERMQRDSGESGRDGRRGSEKEVGRKDGTVAGDGRNSTWS